MKFRDDERALALGLMTFFTILIGAALLFILLNAAWLHIEPMAMGQAAHEQSQDQIELMDRIWGAILYFVLFLAGLFILSRSVFESRLG